MELSHNIDQPPEADQRIRQAADALVAETVSHSIMPALPKRGLTADEGVQAIKLASRLRAEGGVQ